MNSFVSAAPLRPRFLASCAPSVLRRPRPPQSLPWPLEFLPRPPSVRVCRFALRRRRLFRCFVSCFARSASCCSASASCFTCSASCFAASASCLAASISRLVASALASASFACLNSCPRLLSHAHALAPGHLPLPSFWRRRRESMSSGLRLRRRSRLDSRICLLLCGPSVRLCILSRLNSCLSLLNSCVGFRLSGHRVLNSFDQFRF